MCIHTYIHLYKQNMLTLYIQYIYLVKNHWVDLTSSTADLYSVLGSRKITGSGLRMLASRSPFASTGPLGITTYAYIHTYIHTHIHTYHPNIYVYIHTYIHKYIHRWYVITYSLIHNIYIHAFKYTTKTHYCTYIHTYIHTVHTYIHTHNLR